MKTRIALLIVVLATSARAQMSKEGTTVNITLSSSLCSAATNRESRPNCKYPIDVVYNENDVAEMACLTAPPCTWTWTVKTALNPKITPFSLRLGPDIGRTPCRRATATVSNLWNLNVTFSRAGTDRPALEFKITGPTVYYMRIVQPVDKGDVLCGEKRLLSSTVSDVQFGAEDLRLQIYKQKSAYCGVVVDDLLRNRTDVSIGPKELAPAVMNQGLEGKLCYAPTLVDPEVVRESFRKNKPAFTVKRVK